LGRRSAGWRRATDIPEPAILALIEALHDPDLQVRANVAHAFGRMNPVPAEAVPLLAECLSSTDGGLRLNAALALLASAGRSAFDALRPLLDDPNPRLRLIAARRLLTEEPLDTHTAEIVAAALIDPTPSIRKAATELIANLSTAAVPTVLAALGERREEVQESGPRDALTDAIVKLEQLFPAPDAETTAAAV